MFQGQSGYLDHALANASLAAAGDRRRPSGTSTPTSRSRSTTTPSSSRPNHINTLFAPDAYRSSDHDPVLVGVCQAPTLSVRVSPNVLKPPNHQYQTVKATPMASADVVDIELVSATSNEPDNGFDDGDTTNDIVIVDDLTVKLRAERSGIGNGRTYTLTWEATNACGATATATATVVVPKG